MPAIQSLARRATDSDVYGNAPTTRVPGPFWSQDYVGQLDYDLKGQSESVECAQYKLILTCISRP